MRKVFKFLGSAIAVIVVILLIAPVFIPIEHYKSKISQEVKRLTGRDLTIDGDIKLSILPEPSITLNDLKFSSLPEATAMHMAEVNKAVVSLSLGALLSGKIEIAYLELDLPVLTLEKLKSGKANWQFETTNSGSNSNNDNKTNEQQVSKTTLPFVINHITITNGKLNYINKDSQSTFEDIDLNLKIGSFEGPIDFSLKLKTFGEDLYFKGQVPHLGEVIPITTQLNIIDTELFTEGEFDTKAMQYKGKLSLDGEFDDFKEFFAAPEEWDNKYKLRADISINQDLVNLNQIDLSFNKVKVSGQGNYSALKHKGNLHLGLAPGEVDINISPLNQNDSIASKIDIKAKNISELLETLGLAKSQLAQIFKNQMDLSTVVEYKNQVLTIDDINFRVAKAIIKGGMQIKEFSTPIITYDFKTDNGNALINLLSPNFSSPLGDLRLYGEVKKNNNLLKVNHNLSIAQATLNAKGEVKIAGEIEPDLHILVTSSDFGKTLYQISGSDALSQIKNLSLVANVKGGLANKLDINLDKSIIRIGANDTNINGDMEVLLSKKIPNIKAKFQIGNINLDSPPRGKNPNNPAVTASNISGSTPWSNNKIDLSVLNSFNAELNLKIQSLRQNGLLFDNILLNASAGDGVLKIYSLQGDLYGGKVDFTATIPSNPGKNIVFKGNVKNANLKNISPEGSKIKITKGLTNLNFDLNTKGESTFQYASNLAGIANIYGSEGILSGVNLQKIVDALNNIKNLEGVLKVLDVSFSGGETQYKNLEGEIKFERGIGTLMKANLEATSVKANATGFIDLPKYIMEVKTIVQTDIKNIPPFGARLFGSLNSPNHQLDTNALKQHILKNVMNNVIDTIKSGGKPQDILKNVLGGGKAKHPSDSSNQEEEQNSSPAPQNKPVEQLLKKGLKGLLK
jgi:AsmA protein